MENLGTVFQEKLPSTVELENNRIQYLKEQQDNLNLLFNKSLLIDGIEKIFTEIGKEEIDWLTICEYIRIDNYRYHENPSLIILRKIISRQNSHSWSSFEEVKNTINKNESILLSEIRNQLKDIEKKNRTFVILDFHKNFIIDWCLNAYRNIDFTKVIDQDTNRSYINFRIINLIYFFQTFFEFEIDIQFYTRSLEYSDISNDSIKFDYIKGKINDKNLFDRLVIDNINNKVLNYFSLKSHINYALEAKLHNAYEKIGLEILSDDHLHHQDMILSKFYANTRDISFLKKCCHNTKSSLCWASIKILLETAISNDDATREFLINIAKKHMKIVNQYYQMDALGVLFKYNQPDAIEYYYEYILNNKDTSVNFENYKEYSNEKGISKIEKIFFIVYGKEGFDYRELYTARSMFQTYLINLSKNDAFFGFVQSRLKRIKNKLIKIKQDLFYINLLIQESNESNINWKSKPLTFELAKSKFETVIN